MSTEITLTSNTLLENVPGFVVGDIKISDSANDTYTLSLSDADKELFELVDGVLKLKDGISINFEDQEVINITVTATNSAGESFTTSFEISIIDQADAPTGISITQEEPEPPPSEGGDTIEVVVTVVNNQFYFNGVIATEFQLLKGNTYIFQQSNENGNGHVLAISQTQNGSPIADLEYYYTNANGSTFLTNASLYKSYLVDFASFLTGFSFEIHYTVPDSAPDTLYFFSSSSSVTGGVFDITVPQVEPPEPPTDDPDALIINENELGAVVGNLFVIDEDANDTHTYTLSGEDAALFEIVEGELKLRASASANFEAKSKLFVTITATDSTGLSFSKDIQVTIQDTNDVPSGITLSNNTLLENSKGAEVGTVSVIDEDQNDTYSYVIEGEDADLFEITAEGILKLKNNVLADYESKQNLTITIVATDSGGLSVTSEFVINVENVNEPVTNITIDNNPLGFVDNVSVVNEGVLGGVVGSFILDDPDVGENRTFLITGPDAHFFEVVNGQLKVKDGISLDYESISNEYTDEGILYKYLEIEVTVIDSGGFAAKDTFYIFVQDVNDAPTSMRLSANSISLEGVGIIGLLDVTDPDDAALSFTIDNPNFEIIDGVLKVKEGISLEGSLGDSIDVTISATDSANNIITKTFTLTFGGVTLDNYSFEENITNPIIATLSMGNENLSNWTITITGEDAQYFSINGDNQLIYNGTANFEINEEYNLIFVATHNETGQIFNSYQQISVVDRNDPPQLYFSHAYTTYTLGDGDNTYRMFGIVDDVVNPYIVTLQFIDEDSIQSLEGYTIQITYQNQYGETVDITDKFIFDGSTGALYFDGSIDFESLAQPLSGIDDNHRWYDFIEIRVTDAEGASSSINVLMYGTDSSSDGEINLGYAYSFYNANHEQSTSWIGPRDLDTNKIPSITNFSSGDFNGDGITDYIASFTNDDYYYPSNYAFLAITLGGPNIFPHYDPTIETWSGTAQWNNVFGNGLGSVYVYLPAVFNSEYYDLRDFYISELQVADFNNDGFDDFMIVIDSKYSSDSWIVVGYGKNLDNSATQETNVIDLWDLQVGESSSNGFVSYLPDLQNVYIEGFVDANDNGRLDLVYSIYDEATEDYMLVIKDILNGNIIQTIKSPQAGYSELFTYSFQIGDFNGDGRDDIAVSAPGYAGNDTAGAIYIYLNGFGGIPSSPSVTIYGDVNYEITAWSAMHNLGDINGDGRDDLGFADTYGSSWIFWGRSSFQSIYDMTSSQTKSTYFTRLDEEVIDFSSIDVTNVGDINGDGVNDLAYTSSYNNDDYVYVLYGQRSWLSEYFNNSQLNFLSIRENMNLYDLYPLGDIDGDGLDEFAFAAEDYDGHSQWSSPNYLKIWNGFTLSDATQGFSLHLAQYTFSVDEDASSSDIIGTISLLNGKNIENYDVYIVYVEIDGEVLDNEWFDISASGEITLKPGVSLDSETASHMFLTLRIYDSASNQVSQHFIDLFITNVNEAPSLEVTNQNFDTVEAGIVVGNINATDPDGDEIIVQLTGNDADKFIFDSETNQIKFKDDLPNIGDQFIFYVTIIATDVSGAVSSSDHIFEINQAPTDITLSNSVIQESARGVAIGQIIVQDANISESHTFTINGSWSEFFEITEEGILKLRDGGTFYDFLDFEMMGDSITLEITATDSRGASVSKEFTINIVDIAYATLSTPDIIQYPWPYYFFGSGSILDALLVGTSMNPYWLDESFTPVTISYSFVEDESLILPSMDLPEGSLRNPELNGFKDAVRSILTDLGNILGITFVEIDESDTQVGDIRFHLYDADDGSGGYNWPGNIPNSSTGADIAINLNSSNDFEPGDYGYMTILHELGHALGLDHPFAEYDGDTSLATFGRSDLGWYGYTIMDYRDYAGFASGVNVAPGGNAVVINDTNQSFYPSTFMPLDYWTLMFLYNFNPTLNETFLADSNLGDDTYILEGPFFFTIHDMGGIDTLDWSAQSWNTEVNLVPFDPDNSNLNYFGENKLRFIDSSGDAEDVLTGWILGIAPMTFIENIKAGSGNDTVTLNSVANHATLGAGNDTVYDIGQGDTVIGNSGDDNFYALDSSFTLIDGGDGIDSIYIPSTVVASGSYHSLFTGFTDWAITSIDFRNISSLKNIEILNYYDEYAIGNILISEDTFKNMGVNTLVIQPSMQSVGLEGDFSYYASTDSYDIYILEGSQQNYVLWVLKNNEQVFKINDNQLDFSLSNNIIVETDNSDWKVIGELSLLGEEWLSPKGSFDQASNIKGDYIYTISGPDQDKFAIFNGMLYLRGKVNFDNQASYTITITITSVTGKTFAKELTISVKDVDESSFTGSNDVINGNDADDYLNGGQGNDEINGAGGNDYLWGGVGDDIIFGGAGDDIIQGWYGDDELYGGEGDDVIHGVRGSNYIDGGSGNDLIYGSEDGSRNVIEGGLGDDIINAGSGNDLIYGDDADSESQNDGNDIIYAGLGNDEVWGRGGADTIYGFYGDDNLYGGSGDDFLDGGDGNDLLVGMRGDDEINGDFGDDIIFGDNSTGESSADGNDVLRGGYGEDEIYGRGGNDILIGQSGKDTLYGGAGEDIFVIYSVDFNAEDGDTIKDFVDGEDKIGLVGISFDELIILSEGQNTIIQNQSGETVLTLEGVSSTLITTDDFISLNYDLSSNESQVTSSSLYQLSYSYEILDVGPETLGMDNGAGPLSEEFNIFESNHNKTSDFIDIQSHEFSEIDFSNSSIHYETI